ncbi:hypothetical protein PSPO01_02639 [Paraphaeosphaeria sporulosa]
MSREFTVTYYQVIKRRVREVKGGLHMRLYSCVLSTSQELQSSNTPMSGKRLVCF